MTTDWLNDDAQFLLLSDVGVPDGYIWTAKREGAILLDSRPGLIALHICLPLEIEGEVVVDVHLSWGPWRRHVRLEHLTNLGAFLLFNNGDTKPPPIHVTTSEPTFRTRVVSRRPLIRLNGPGGSLYAVDINKGWERA